MTKRHGFLTDRRRILRCFERWRPRTGYELQNVIDGIPAGATTIWQPRKLQIEWKIPDVQRSFHEVKGAVRIFPGWIPPSK
jgi:hypothetical protein